MEIKLDSKIIKDYDYHLVDLSRFARKTEINQEKLDRALLKYRTRFATKEEVSEIADRDLVTLTMVSDTPRFNKAHINARIGLGLLTKELEGQLIGAKLNSTVSLTVKDSAVTVTIEKIVREIVPELTDELVRKAGEKGFSCKQDVITKSLADIYAEDLEIECDDAFTALGKAVSDNSIVEILPEESEIGYTDLCKMMQGPGKDMTEQMIRDMAKGMIASAVRGQNILEAEDGLYEEEDYERYLEEEAKRRHCTAEDVRADVPVKAYLMWEYSTIYMDILEDYAEKEVVRLSTKDN